MLATPDFWWGVLAGAGAATLAVFGAVYAFFCVLGSTK